MTRKCDVYNNLRTEYDAAYDAYENGGVIDLAMAIADEMRAKEDYRNNLDRVEE